MVDRGRREFIGKMLAAGALAVSGVGFGSKAEAQGQKTKEQYLSDFYKLDRKLKEVSASYGDYGSRTPEDQDRVHDDFLKQFGPDGKNHAMMNDYLESSFASDCIADAFERLSDFDCQFLVLEYFRQLGRYETRHHFMDKDRKIIYALSINADTTQRYKIRAKDFLPIGSELEPRELDPRLDRTIYNIDIDPGLDTADIAIHPGFLTPERQEQCRNLIDKPEFRARVQNESLTLAEVYSLIKAVIVYKDRDPESSLSELEIIDKLLEERRVFLKKVILGPETKRFIHFNFIEPGGTQFNGDVFDMIAEKAGVPKDNVTRTDINDRSESSAVLSTKEAIWNSRGKTTILFNTHGRPEELSVRFGEKKYDEKISPEDIAEPLITRLQNSRDVNSLSDVTIIVDACYSYDFIQNVIRALRDVFQNRKVLVSTEGELLISLETYLGASFEEIGLPTMIAGTQEYSIGISSNSNLEGVLQNKSSAIEKTGTLTGDYLLRVAQPAHYGSADYTFFAGKAGKLLEFGANDHKLNEDNSRPV